MKNTQTVKELLEILSKNNEANGAKYPVMIMRNDWLPEMFESMTEALNKTQHKNREVLEFSMFDHRGRMNKDGRIHITAR